MQAARTNAVKALHRFGPPTLIMLGSLWLLQAAFAHTGSHGVIIRNLSYDAGAVKSGTLIHDTVYLTNLSVQPVSVDALPACGCTVADIPFRPLSPLHSEDVGFEIDTAGMAVGPQRKLVLVHLHSGSKDWQILASIKFQLQ